MFRYIYLTVIVLLLLSLFNVQLGQAQDDRTCLTLIEKALSELGINCADLESNFVCYGFQQLQTIFTTPVDTDYFSQVGDITELSSIESIQTSAFDSDESQWGVAVFNVLTENADQELILLLLGDVYIESVTPENPLFRFNVPMRTFSLRTGEETVECMAAPPPTLVVQGPQDEAVDLTVNGIDIRVTATIFLRTLPNGDLQIIIGDGTAILYPDTPYEIELLPVTSVDIPLNEAGQVKTYGMWTNWQVLSQSEIDQFDVLSLIPSNIWNTYVGPTVVKGSGVGEVVWTVLTRIFQGILTPPAAGQALIRGTWTPIQIGGPAFPDWILYHGTRDGDWDVYRFDFGTWESTNVSVSTDSVDLQPSYSIDGHWVTFASNRVGASNWEIFIARYDGTQPQRLTYNTTTDINPAWGPDTQIVFESNRHQNWDLYLFDVAIGGEPQRLTNNPGADINAFWSPDGQYIVFQSNRDGDWDIYKLDLATNELESLTSNTIDDLRPVISYDGKMMTWLQHDTDNINSLWLMDLDTGQSRQLVTGPDIGSHAFSPDDTFIVYHSNVDGDFDIFAIDIQTEQIKALTENDITDKNPTFRIDSPLVVYESIIPADEPDALPQAELFQIDPLPLNGPLGEPVRLTSTEDIHELCPLGAGRSEFNSREGRLPQIKR